MARMSFFAKLKSCQDTICNDSARHKDNNGDIVYYSEDTKSVIKELILFIETHPFTTSKNISFVCEHWSLSQSDMCKIWNRTNTKEKSEHTISQQVSTVSKQMIDYFGNNIFDDLYAEENIQELHDKILFITHEEISFDDFVIPEVKSYLQKYSGKEYSLDECEKEIELVKTLRRETIFNYLDTIDSDKLSYIKFILNKPITNNQRGQVNHVKIDLLHRLDECVTSVYKQLSSKSIYDEDIDEEETEKNVEKETDNDKKQSDFVENKSDLCERYGLSEEQIENIILYYQREQRMKRLYKTGNLLDMLDVFNKNIQTNQDVVTDVEQEKAIKMICNFFDILSSDFINRKLQNISSETILKALEVRKEI